MQLHSASVVYIIQMSAVQQNHMAVDLTETSSVFAVLTKLPGVNHVS
jgi:hypothetical protein